MTTNDDRPITRAITASIQKDAEKKIVLLSGPRQVGKTFLAKGLHFKNQVYLNFDSAEDRAKIRQMSWDRKADVVIFDEIHKMPKFKSWIKGIYDTEGVRPRLLVTGSASFDLMKRAGDSLAGRHFSYRLLPLSVKEVGGNASHALEQLMITGGFPEPFLSGSEEAAKRWRRSHLDRIIRGDLIDLETVKNLYGLTTLVDLLAERVGSPVSLNSLAQILEISPHTVKRWTELLELLYVLFKVTPYTQKLSRSLQKESKFYFFDYGLVPNRAARFENLIALSLLKENFYLEDTQGLTTKLHYARNKEKQEIDFVILHDRKIMRLVEAKLSAENFEKNMFYFNERLKPKSTVLITLEGKKVHQKGNVRIEPAHQFLAGLES